MKNDAPFPLVFSSISALHQALGLPKPLHPLVNRLASGSEEVLYLPNYPC
jgi:hypothetical protein